MSLRKLPLVKIEWNDITTHDQWISDKTNYTKEGVTCVSVGWKLKSNRKTVVITPMRNDEGRCNDRQIIPRGCIKSIKRLE